MNLKRTALLGLKIAALTPWMVAVQAGRGILWAALALPLIRTFRFGLFVGWMLARRHSSLAVCASPQRSELPA